ncbi:hypothetical protein ASD40_33430 [Paenibacillus sp. Root444D2]|nr:hypothetical protein ASD40_33430 [Paenibacillus sp. Root444D2]KRE41212.1 hypothetical protein ASG85_34095 [Paenibacillus sp. Soil724D2]
MEKVYCIRCQSLEFKGQDNTIFKTGFHIEEGICYNVSLCKPKPNNIQSLGDPEKKYERIKP